MLTRPACFYCGDHVSTVVCPKHPGFVPFTVPVTKPPADEVLGIVRARGETLTKAMIEEVDDWARCRGDERLRRYCADARIIGASYMGWTRKAEACQRIAAIWNALHPEGMRSERAKGRAA